MKHFKSVVAVGFLLFSGISVANEECSFKSQFDSFSDLRTYSSNLYSARSLMRRSRQRIESIVRNLDSMESNSICSSVFLTMENVQFTHELLMDSDKILVTAYAMQDYASLTPDRQGQLEELHGGLGVLFDSCKNQTINKYLIDSDMGRILGMVEKSFDYLTTAENLTFKIMLAENKKLEQAAKDCDLKVSANGSESR